MIVALLLPAGTIVSLALDSDAGTQSANAAAHQDRWLIALVLFGPGWIAFVRALLGIMHVLRERGVTFGPVGGAKALLCALASVGYLAIGFAIGQMPSAVRRRHSDDRSDVRTVARARGRTTT